MEKWEIDFHWLKVRHYIRDVFKTSSLPDLETILFLIGVRELGSMQTEFSKEEKMQLMHIATASLLVNEGYFDLDGVDENSWPVYKEIKTIDFDEKGRQEKLQIRIIEYFEEFIHEEEE